MDDFWGMILDLFFLGGDFGGFLHLEWAIRHDGGYLYVWCLDNLITCYLHEIGTVAVGPTTRVIRTLIRVLLNHETSPQHCWWLTVGWGRRIQILGMR